MLIRSGSNQPLRYRDESIKGKKAMLLTKKLRKQTKRTPKK